MKPHRLVMTHHLVMSYDLHKRMEIYVRVVLSAPFDATLGLTHSPRVFTAAPTGVCQ